MSGRDTFFTAELPPTERMLEALRLRDEGLSNTEVAHRLGCNSRYVSDLLRVGALRTGRPLPRRAAPTPPDDALRKRVSRLEDRNQSLRARLTSLEREVALLRKQLPPPVTHRRIADGGVGGRREQRGMAA